jgi:hypothetical protein
MAEKTPTQYDPRKNPDTIALTRQPDGNWTAEGQRFGKVIRVRGGQPHAVLEGFLTHDGHIDEKIV